LNIPAFHFDENLREVPDSFEDWQTFYVELEKQLDSNLGSNRDIEFNNEKTLNMLEVLGTAARILHRYDKAEAYLSHAVLVARGLNSQRRLIQNLVRLAHVHQWKNDFKQAQHFFSEASLLIEQNDISDLLLASYHQHFGKFYFDQQYYGKAEEEFQKALTLRQQRQAPKDQVDSSILSLEETRRRLGKFKPKLAIV